MASLSDSLSASRLYPILDSLPSQPNDKPVTIQTTEEAPPYLSFTAGQQNKVRSPGDVLPLSMAPLNRNGSSASSSSSVPVHSLSLSAPPPAFNPLFESEPKAAPANGVLILPPRCFSGPSSFPSAPLPLPVDLPKAPASKSPPPPKKPKTWTEFGIELSLDAFALGIRGVAAAIKFSFQQGANAWEWSGQQRQLFMINRLDDNALASAKNRPMLTRALEQKKHTGGQLVRSQHLRLELERLSEQTKKFLAGFPGTPENLEAHQNTESWKNMLTLSVGKAKRELAEVESKMVEQMWKKAKMLCDGHPRFEPTLSPYVLLNAYSAPYVFTPAATQAIDQMVRPAGHAQGEFTLEQARQKFLDTRKELLQIRSYLITDARNLLLEIENSRKQTIQTERISSLALKAIRGRVVTDLKSIDHTPPPSTATYDFYNRFRMIHRGGDVLKKEGEFVFVECDHQISRELEQQIQGFEALIPPMSEKADQHGVGLRAKLQEGRLVPDKNGPFRIYTLRLSKATKDADHTDFGSRHRISLQESRDGTLSVKFQVKKHSYDAENAEWNKDRVRSAAICRLEAMAFMREFSKLALSDNPQRLTLNHYLDTTAYLDALDSSDLSQLPNGGYASEPVYQGQRTLFNSAVRPLLEENAVERQTHEKIQATLADKKYTWDMDVQRAIGLQMIVKALWKFSEFSMELYNMAQTQPKFQYIAEEARKLSLEATRILGHMEAGRGEYKFMQPGQNPNPVPFMRLADVDGRIAHMAENFVANLQQFYALTEDLALISQSDTIRRKIEEYTDAGFLHATKKQLQMGIAKLTKSIVIPEPTEKEKLRTKLMGAASVMQVFNSDLPQFPDAMRDVVKGTPFGRTMMQNLGNYRNTLTLTGKKEASRLQRMHGLESTHGYQGVKDLFFNSEQQKS